MGNWLLSPLSAILLLYHNYNVLYLWVEVARSRLIDWLVFNANFSSILAISWLEQILLLTLTLSRPLEKNPILVYKRIGLYVQIIELEVEVAQCLVFCIVSCQPLFDLSFLFSRCILCPSNNDFLLYPTNLVSSHLPYHEMAGNNPAMSRSLETWIFKIGIKSRIDVSAVNESLKIQTGYSETVNQQHNGWNKKDKRTCNQYSTKRYIEN